VSIPLHFELNPSLSIKSLESKEKQSNSEQNKPNNVEDSAGGSKKDIEIPTAEIIRILNQFVFYLFLIYIVLLNLLGLWIFPYYVKEPLTLKG